jgi:hypothetical protein
MYPVRFGVGVWAGIVQDIVLGPYLLPDKLAAERYSNFLQTDLLMMLLVVLLVVRQSFRFQFDGAVAHYG